MSACHAVRNHGLSAPDSLDRRRPTLSATETDRPGDAPEELSREEILRYSRHLVMPDVGVAGQRRLKSARVLVVGAGGLGSPLGIYLAAAGVGSLGVVDFDRVETSNLHRQPLYGDADVGRRKSNVAAARLRQVNPHIEVVPHDLRLDSSNALQVLADYDVVVDGTDNFPTRYLVNDACVLLGKPDVYGSIFRFEGQVSVFESSQGPCYRCLFPEPPPPGLVPSCAEGGVLGVLPGIIGTLQANEVIKLILGIGEPLIGRLLLFDGLTMRFREMRLRKNPDCPVCAENPRQTELIDYQGFCGLGEPEVLATDFDLSARELESWLGSGRSATLLDVRSPEEYEICALPGARLIPLPQLPDRLGELDTADDLVVYCRSGVRSARAVDLLHRMGFAKARNLAGGIVGWSRAVDPSMPVY